MKLHTQPWTDDLIWCPSQCCMNFYIVRGYTKHFYCLYLRWRWQDPWQVVLVECDSNYDMHSGGKWYVLRIRPFKDTDDLALIKNTAIRMVKKLLDKKKIILPTW